MIKTHWHNGNCLTPAHLPTIGRLIFATAGADPLGRNARKNPVLGADASGRNARKNPVLGADASGRNARKNPALVVLFLENTREFQEHY